MIKNIFTILLLYIFVISCTTNEVVDKPNDRFPVLSYSAEISETLNIDLDKINIDKPEENFWTQHFQIHQII